MNSKFWLLLFGLFALTGATQRSALGLRVDSYQVSAIYPHDARAFTEGLFYASGFFYESTGLEGQSSIRKVIVTSGKVVRSVRLPASLFGEGIVNWKHEIISLTWRNGIGFRWHIDSFKPRGRFSYQGEGWGLTQDGKSLIMSNGSADIQFLDPDNFAVRKRVKVTLRGQPLANLNELEWVKGQIYANIWLTNAIVVIDPDSGDVKRVIDLTALADMSGRARVDDVLNGIAYDEASDRLWITGKNWPTLFELKPVPTK